MPKRFRRSLLKTIIADLHSPISPSRRKKKLSEDRPPYFHGKEVWQLRIDGYRIFYEIFGAKKIVVVFFLGKRAQRQPSSCMIKGAKMATVDRIHGIREVKENLSRYIRQARSEPVIITNHGKFSAILFDVSDKNPEDILLFTSKKFQNAIKYDRRKNVTAAALLKRY